MQAAFQYGQQDFVQVVDEHRAKNHVGKAVDVFFIAQNY